MKRKLRENEMKSGIKVREMGETYVDKDRAIAVVIGNTKMTSLPSLHFLMLSPCLVHFFCITF